MPLTISKVIQKRMLISNKFVLICFFLLTSRTTGNKEECIARLRIDLLFMVDASDAVDEFSFEFYVKDYINDIAKRLPIGPDNVLISVVLYARDPVLAIDPVQIITLPDLLMAVRHLPHLGGSPASAEHAVRTTIKTAFDSRRDTTAEHVDRILVIIDGTVEDPVPKSVGIQYTDKLHAYRILRNNGRFASLKQELNQYVDRVFTIGFSKDIYLLANDRSHTLRLFPETGYRKMTLEELDPISLLCQTVRSYRAPLVHNVRSNIFNTGIYVHPNEGQISKISNTARQNGGSRAPLKFMCLPVFLDRYLLSTHNIAVVGGGVGETKGDPKLGYVFKRQGSVYPLTHPLIRTQMRSGQYVQPMQVLLNRRGLDLQKIHHHNGSTLRGIVRGPLGERSEVPSHKFTVSSTNADVSKSLEHQNVLASKIVSKKPIHTHMLYTDSSERAIPAEQGYEIAQALMKILAGEAAVTKGSSEENQKPSKQETTDNVQVTPEILTAILNVLTDSELANYVRRQFVPENTLKSPVQTKNNGQIKPSDWRDSAMHGGALLVFAVRAHSDESVVKAYSDSEISGYFKDSKFDHWVSGTYERAILELWYEKQPVVRLVFDARMADKYNWFQKSLLLDSYPWDKEHLKQQADFPQSRNDPFSILHSGGSNNARDRKSYGAVLNCAELRGYLLVMDEDSSTSACSWASKFTSVTSQINTNSSEESRHHYPVFLYTLPPILWGSETASVPLFDSLDSNTIRQADELRVYAVPYSLISSNDEFNTPSAYSLLLALDLQTGISFNQIWHQKLSSPPGNNPILVNVSKTKVDRCRCWFRSRALENWHGQHSSSDPPRFSPLIGYPLMRVELTDEYGNIKARLTFDTRGASADFWFTPTRLKEAWPWPVSTLRSYNFVQFGRPTYLLEQIDNLDDWRSIALWIGRLHHKRDGSSQTNSIEICRSLVLVADFDKPGPKCLRNMTDLIQTSVTSYMGMSEHPRSLENMSPLQQIIIWSS
ncbi:unnamed protein product [Calicophoron daubneyi]|uniref:VWFA domain-containing protein n=1 Tax=Calicophoron daubneyi TaxID=300641 RepID=A0AAV2TYM5_CALDB